MGCLQALLATAYSKFYASIYNMHDQIPTTRGFVPLALFFLTLLDVNANPLKKIVDNSLDNEVCERNIVRCLYELLCCFCVRIMEELS